MNTAMTTRQGGVYLRSASLVLAATICFSLGGLMVRSMEAATAWQGSDLPIAQPRGVSAPRPGRAIQAPFRDQVS